ncbi:Formyl transferase [Naviculisporaceae sp. PSN 640]
MAFLLRSTPGYLHLARKRVSISPTLCIISRTTAYSKQSSLRTRPFSTGDKSRRDPLRVLFCGSDSFSQASLDALIKEHKNNPGLVQSIDVAVRPLKPVGRGLKQLAPKGPMHILAEQHGLPLHEIDTFTGWNLPQYAVPINLIIAVSFGLFVPPRILRAAEYGGLNVHPSLLPDLRGPAPIHHAILSRDTHTGVSLQTLSDKTFDAGAILAQTPRPGIPINPSWDVSTLNQRLAAIGAKMLIQGLRDGVYIPPYTDVVGHYSAANQQQRHAPKLEKFDYQIQWDSWTASDATVRSIKLQEKLWTTAINKKGQPQRWTIENVEEVDPKDPSIWTDEMKVFARYIQATRAKQQGSETMEGGEDNFNINGLNTLVFRQTLQRPPKKSNKARSIFNSGSDSDSASASANPTEKTTVTSKSDSSSSATQQQEEKPSTIDIRLPYFLSNTKNPKPEKSQPEAAKAIIIPLPKGGLLRITKITVEGKKEQSASIVAEAHKQQQPQQTETSSSTQSSDSSGSGSGDFLMPFLSGNPNPSYFRDPFY